ncbi:MAG: serine hydrolase [Sedimentibacter sp.]|uniref:serine hydrolase domain-containing protein n=1 Tax=Sedimentibacter sp. TaxID=1960295 RepID=UPI0031598455
MMDKVKEIEKVFREKCSNTGAVVVQKNGVRVYEYYQNDCTENSPFHVFSVTKSILSILLGIAIDKGYIKSIDQPILNFFPDYTIKKREKTIQQIKLRDMMTMTAPFKFKSAPYTKYFTSEDWVKSSLDLLGGKGTIGEFRYAPLIGPDIFSGVLVETTGTSVLNFANKYLFRPLEIEVQGDVVFHSKEEQMEFYKSRTARGWVAGPTGVHTGGWGLMLTPNDMIKLGQLYLNDGQWNGQQIVSKEWIRESTEEKSRWGELKYGLLWWIIDEEDHSFAALGDGGNVIYVNPKQKTVIIIASYFKPKVEDRIKIIKEYIEPIWSD